MAVFDPSRCALVERCGETPVWRGNIPINEDGDFAYHEMAVALEIDPEQPLIDVSLIDNIEGGERDQWLVEMDAYGVPVTAFPGGPDIPPQFNQPGWNPARLLGDGVRLRHGTAPGHLCWWQIEGGDSPITLGPAERSYNFVGLIEYLGALRSASGTLVYFHCMNGTDRTGAVSAGYAMRHLGMGLEEALKFAASVPAAGVMSDPYRQLVEGYSRWLAENSH